MLTSTFALVVILNSVYFVAAAAITGTLWSHYRVPAFCGVQRRARVDIPVLAGTAPTLPRIERAEKVTVQVGHHATQLVEVERTIEHLYSVVARQQQTLGLIHDMAHKLYVRDEAGRFRRMNDCTFDQSIDGWIYTAEAKCAVDT